MAFGYGLGFNTACYALTIASLFLVLVFNFIFTNSGFGTLNQ